MKSRLFCALATLVLATSSASAGEAVFRLLDRLPVVPVVVTPPPPPQPVVVKVTFEKKCSFDVVKLSPGVYRSGILFSREIYELWGATSGQSNKWLYAHVADSCVATAGSVGYRYSWSTTAATRYSTTLAATGRASASVTDDVLTITVTAPIWLAGELAAGIALSRVN